RWIVQLPIGHPRPRAGVDAECRAGMGLAHLARAAPAVLALFHHQSARAIPLVQPKPVRRHQPGTERADMSDRPIVLVTGGAGYIGSHACRALEAAGYQPLVYDNLSTGHRSFVGGPLVVGDLLDTGALARVFAQHQIAAVMHF